MSGDADFESAANFRALTELRTRQELNPTSRDFDPAALAAFHERFPGGPVRAIVELGVALHADMAAVRQRLGEIASDFDPSANRAHQCLALANALSLDVERGRKNSSEREDSHLIADFEAARPLVGVEMNLPPTFEAFVEAVYDGLRLPLLHFIADGQKGSGRRLRSAFVDPKLSEEINKLAGIYNCLEYVWGMVIWREWSVSIRDDQFHLFPADELLAKSVGIAQHINQVEKVKAGGIGSFNWSSLSFSTQAQLALPAARVTIASGAAKIRWIRGAEPRPGLDFLAFQSLALRGLAGVVEACTPVPGVAARDAIRFRALLRNIGEGLQEAIESGDSSAQAHSALLATMDRGELCRAVREVFGWPVQRVVECINLYTLRSPRSETWFQPLVDLGNNRIGFCLHPLRFSSVLRDAEWLLSLDRKKQGEKGTQFENDVFEFLSELARSNNVIKVLLYPRVKTRNEIGDIDIVLKFGSILLIIECKCPNLPSSQHDFFNRKSTVAHGARQAVRKCEYVSANIETFVRTLGLSESPKVIVPIVLIAGQEYVGVASEGVAVISRSSLASAVSNWKEEIVGMGPDGVQTIGRRERLFGSKDEAEVGLLEAIRSPPEMSFYSEYVRYEEARYWSLVHDRFRYFMKFPDVVFDADAKAAYLQKVGFPA